MVGEEEEEDGFGPRFVVIVELIRFLTFPLPTNVIIISISCH